MDPEIRLRDHKQVACPIPRVCLKDLMMDVAKESGSQPAVEVEEAKNIV